MRYLFLVNRDYKAFHEEHSRMAHRLPGNTFGDELIHYVVIVFHPNVYPLQLSAVR